MTRELRAVLIAEIGSVTTRVTLVDMVEGEYRMVGRAEVLSTLESPTADALLAVLAGAEQIAEATVRELLIGGRLIMPCNADGDGVDALVACTSAAGILPMVITAVASDISAQSAIRASRSTYTSVLQVITLDDPGRGPTSDTTWLERQVQALLGVQPQLVLMAGGLEHGADEVLVRLAKIVGLTAQRSSVDEDGQARQHVERRLVLYAGNSRASDQVVEVLAGKAEPIVVENLRPSLEVEDLEPTRAELARIYERRLLPQLPGYHSLRQLGAEQIGTVAATLSLMTRYTAERNRRDVLTVDIGALTTACYLASQGRFNPTLMAGIGVGYGASNVLAERGAAAIARWLPFDVAEDELAHWVLNKTLRPHVQPVSRRDLFFELALAREALALAAEALRDERGDLSYDLLIACGGVLAHAPQPGLAALVLLDALRPRGAVSERLLDLHLDTLGLLPAAGALAARSAEAAIQLFERDGLQNAPLATCVVVEGSGRRGEQALEAELRLSGGETRRLTVGQGEIVRLPLERGRKAELTLRPAAGVRVGRSAPGKEVNSEPPGILGSTLGVLIDARGALPALLADPAERPEQIWRWMTALDAAQGENPFRALAAPRRIIFATNGALPPVPPEQASAAPDTAPAQAPQVPPPAPASEADSQVERDLAKLRQSFKEEPAKKGWFRRR
jgi:uncharacterized protein (TIGR01319 family)